MVDYYKIQIHKTKWFEPKFNNWRNNKTGKSRKKTEIERARREMNQAF